jgi:hypothetical protein
MSSTRVTVGGLFGMGPEGLSSDQIPDAALTHVYAQMQEHIQDKAGTAWKMVQANLDQHLARLLDIDVVRLLIDGWNKSRELRKYRDDTAYPPDEVVVVALSKHKLDSKHTPHLELVVADRTVGRLNFQIDLALNIDGAQLTIQGGRIKRIATGKTSGTGTLKCEGVIVGQKDAKLGALPGSIDLGTGIPIPA